MRSTIFLFYIVLVAAMILIPTIFVTVLGQPNSGDNRIIREVEQLSTNQKKIITISVYRSKTNTIEKYPLEEYIRGVVAAEMPIDFELEALKAQAIAARTYIVKRIIEKDFSDVPQGVMVTDTINHQVFLSDSELKQQWGIEYYERISKLNRVINETSGQVITYAGKPITALYFSTSNGYTENSEDYYGKEVPYLKSVTSPWDQNSPKFQTVTSFPLTEIKSKLKLDTSVQVTTNSQWIKVIEKTAGNRIKKIKLGDKLFSGRELREALGLNSSSFTWEITKDAIIFHTKGYGHGVGMSQYGANGMAKEGRSVEEILKYYYTGIEITNIQKWIR